MRASLRTGRYCEIHALRSECMRQTKSPWYPQMHHKNVCAQEWLYAVLIDLDMCWLMHSANAGATDAGYMQTHKDTCVEADNHTNVCAQEWLYTVLIMNARRRPRVSAPSYVCHVALSAHACMYHESERLRAGLPNVLCLSRLVYCLHVPLIFTYLNGSNVRSMGVVELFQRYMFA